MAADLLAEFRGYEGWGPQLDDLAVRASREGRLVEAYEAAVAQFFAATGKSALSSRTVIFVDRTGIQRNQQAFLLLLRHELYTVLGEVRL